MVILLVLKEGGALASCHQTHLGLRVFGGFLKNCTMTHPRVSTWRAFELRYADFFTYWYDTGDIYRFINLN